MGYRITTLRGTLALLLQENTNICSLRLSCQYGLQVFSMKVLNLAIVPNVLSA